MKTTMQGPIAVGGVGGSGTRIIAGFLQDLGVFIGSDLPTTADTIWYAALFGRRDVLVEDQTTLRALSDLFFAQMRRAQPLTVAEQALLSEVRRLPRHQHRPHMVEKWVNSFVAHTQSGADHPLWGWKVPYTHVLIDQLLPAYPDLKYVHITRNGVDMAFNKNQNQLGEWGPVFLSRNVEIGPHDSLAYWCAVHRRMARINARFPGRIHDLDYDRLIADPHRELGRLFDFLGAGLDKPQLNAFADQIFVPESVVNRPTRDLSVFDAYDLEYANAQTRNEPA